MAGRHSDRRSLVSGIDPAIDINPAIATGTGARPMSIRNKDLPLKEDIRLLGRMLGGTIKALEGQDTFDSIETIRQLSVRAARDDDPAARALLARTLNRLSRERTVSVVRAFPTSRIWPTSPKTSITAAASAPI